MPNEIATTVPAIITTCVNSVELQRLIEESEQFRRAARSERTWSAYRSDLRVFAAWADQHGVSALPATPEGVVAYLTTCASRYRPATIRRHLAAISVAHKLAGHESPTKHPVVTEVLKGIERTLGIAQSRKRALTVQELRQISKKLPNNRRGARDRAILLLGVSGALRRSEIVAFDVNDIAFVEDGMIVTLRVSKSDQERAGVEIGVPYAANEYTCCVRAVKRWLEVAGITDGPMFRGVDRGDRVSDQRLSAMGVVRLVKSACASIGLDVRKVSGHSLRASYATIGAAAGVSPFSLAEGGRWKSLNVLQRYVRSVNIIKDNPVASFGF